MTSCAVAGNRTDSYKDSPLRQVTGDTLRPGGLELTRRALALCAFPPGARILDMGCGPGASLGLFREQGLCALGLDHSPALLAEARLRGPVLAADFHAPPLADSCLEGIFCECVLSLGRDKAVILAECRRMLRPGGRLVLSDLVLPGDPASPPAYASIPCVRGASTSEAYLSLLNASGFSVCHAEDHTPMLRDLAARLVFAFGSLEEWLRLWSQGPGTSGNAGGESACASRGAAYPRLGYMLFVATREGTER